MSWIQFILEWLHQFWPIRIVYSYQQGVRFWLGEDTKELTTGCYWFLPFFGNIEIVPTVPDVLDLGIHSITTKDNWCITFSANVAYEITSARLMFTKVQDFETSLQRIAEGHIASKVRDWTYEELIDSQKDLERSLKDTLETRAKNWGVKIHVVWVTDLVKARQYRLFMQ